MAHTSAILAAAIGPTQSVCSLRTLSHTTCSHLDGLSLTTAQAVTSDLFLDNVAVLRVNTNPTTNFMTEYFDVVQHHCSKTISCVTWPPHLLGLPGHSGQARNSLVRGALVKGWFALRRIRTPTRRTRVRRRSTGKRWIRQSLILAQVLLRLRWITAPWSRSASIATTRSGTEPRTSRISRTRRV